jgi:hypothetical protein
MIDAWLSKHSDLAALLIVTAGFALRIRAAAGTFLNPDEALHFLTADQASLRMAYRASLTLAHPPLLVFLLYFWSHLGTSEFVLRLPSVILGTAFCWVFFKWLETTVGTVAGLSGTVLMALLPPMVALSAEVRQYSLMLFFIAGASFLWERAIARSSATLMAISSTCVWLGMLSHYSGLVFATAFGIYSLLSVIQYRPTQKLIATWGLGQAGVIAFFVLLYRTHISTLTSSAMGESAVSEWLRRSYFHPGQDRLVLFVVGRGFAVFQFVLGQRLVGIVAGLVFLAGIVFLLRGKLSGAETTATPRRLAIFLVLPFAINCALALAGRYPYGGTRHSAFLAMFAAAGIGSFFAAVARQRMTTAIAAALGVVCICSVFSSRHQPYIASKDQSRARMDQAIEAIRLGIPPSEPIFVDYQTSLLLGHYLCGQQASAGGSGQESSANSWMGPRFESVPALVPTHNMLHCGDHTLILSLGREEIFTPDTFLHSWDQFVRSNALQPGSGVWVVQAGWGSSLASGSQRRLNGISPSNIQSFGQNITIFRLTVGNPLTLTG